MKNIFDFDETITKSHTFSANFYDIYRDELANNPSCIYDAGKLNAESNAKDGILDYLKHDVNNLSAISTFHNNPEFIAGFIAGLFKKELCLIDTTTSEESPHSPRVAINIYTIEGLDTPFLISYLPFYGEEYSNKIEIFNSIGKNKQLLFLRETLEAKQLVEPDEHIDFYEDSPSNFKKASYLRNFKSHLIDRKNPTFTIKQLGSFNSLRFQLTRSASPNPYDESTSSETSHGFN